MARKIPWGKILEVAGAGRDAREGGSEAVRVWVRISSGAPRGLVLAIKEALVAREATGIVDVRPVDAPAPDGVAPDALVIVCGEQTAAEAALARDAARRAVPVALVAESAVEVPDVELPEEALPFLEVLACADALALVPRLGTWLVGATDKGLALCGNFPSGRPAEVDSPGEALRHGECCRGGCDPIPGSDMAVMTANQVPARHRGCLWAWPRPQALELAGGWRRLWLPCAGPRCLARCSRPWLGVQGCHGLCRHRGYGTRAAGSL